MLTEEIIKSNSINEALIESNTIMHNMSDISFRSVD